MVATSARSRLPKPLAFTANRRRWSSVSRSRRSPSCSRSTRFSSRNYSIAFSWSWFIQPAREISKKRNGSRNFDIGRFIIRRSQGSSPAVSDRSRLRAIRDLLSGEIDQWLRFWKNGRARAFADFSLRWSTQTRKWELQIEYQGYLFAAIALQLTLVVAEADSLYTCSACGLPYIRTKKRPKAGWANYCDQCIKRGIGARRAVESNRKRKTEAKRLAAEGVPVPEIAAKVNSDPETVKGWLRKRK
jgi:hypothetical protein